MNGKTRKKLYYFTESYPYGHSMQWKKNELEVLKNYFDITVIPHTFDGNEQARNLVEGVKYLEPLVKNDKKTKTKVFTSVAKLFFSYRFTKKLFTEFVENKVYSSIPKLRNFVGFCYMLSLLERNETYRQILLENKPDTILYYFWGIGPVNLLPFITECKTAAICRFNGWDTYSERHPDNYLPLQKLTLERLNIVLPCSDQGNKYLREKFPSIENKLTTARLSTLSKVTNNYLSDGVLKIVTCSFAVPVKRLHLLCDCLRKISIPVKWTHIGGGPLLDDLKCEAEKFPSNVQAEFTGTVEAGEIYKIYKEKTLDLFLNVSESEGVPVSIMEAFAASIPVYATDVGGTGEIVDDSVGKLLPADLTHEQLREFLVEFHRLSDEEKIKLRKRAYTRFMEKSDAVANAHKIVELISELN